MDQVRGIDVLRERPGGAGGRSDATPTGHLSSPSLPPIDDWQPIEVRSSLRWAFRGFVAFALLVGGLIVVELLSSEEPVEQPRTTIPAVDDGATEADRGLTSEQDF